MVERTEPARPLAVERRLGASIAPMQEVCRTSQLDWALAVGESASVGPVAQSARLYSISDECVFDVLLSPDNDKFIIVGVAPGIASLSLIAQSGEQSVQSICVYQRLAPGVIEAATWWARGQRALGDAATRETAATPWVHSLVEVGETVSLPWARADTSAAAPVERLGVELVDGELRAHGRTAGPASLTWHVGERTCSQSFLVTPPLPLDARR
jgi:hypothetical protein